MPSHTATQYANPKAKNYMVGSIYKKSKAFPLLAYGMLS